MDVTVNLYDILQQTDKITIYGVFYKSNKHWWSSLIKWWTHTNYSHCELLIKLEKDTTDVVQTDGISYYLVGISTEQRVRMKPYDYNSKKNNWDAIEIKTLNNKVIKKEDLIKHLGDFFKETQGFKYDWLGIFLTDFFNRGKEDRKKYTCSEWLGELFDRVSDTYYPKKYIRLLPQDIHDTLL